MEKIKLLYHAWIKAYKDINKSKIKAKNDLKEFKKFIQKVKLVNKCLHIAYKVLNKPNWVALHDGWYNNLRIFIREYSKFYDYNIEYIEEDYKKIKDYYNTCSTEEEYASLSESIKNMLSKRQEEVLNDRWYRYYYRSLDDNFRDRLRRVDDEESGILEKIRKYQFADK